MTNLQILYFFQKLINNNHLKESLEIISGLDIKNFDNQFYDEWKKIDWNQKFENKENLLVIFIDKVLELVTSLKDFDILFNLLNTNSSNNVIEISPSTLEKIQIKFIELCKVFDFNKNKDFDLNNIIISIITYSKK